MRKTIVAGLFAMVVVAVLCYNGLPTARSAPAEAQPFAEARAIADRVAAHVEERDIAAAFDVMREHWPLPETEIDTLEMHTIRQRSTVDARFGQTLAVEFVRQEMVGESFVRFIYMEKFERHAIIWKLDFYKPKGEWTFNSLMWNDDVQAMFAPSP